MMKEQAIKRINKFGKIGGIVTTVLKVLAIIGFALTLIAAIITAILPKDLVHVQVDTIVGVTVDLDSMGIEMNNTEREELSQALLEGMESGNASVNGVTAEVTQLEVDGNTIQTKVETADDLDRYVSMRTATWVLLMASLDIAAIVVVLFFLGKLFREFAQCETPFSAGVITRMKRFAYALIPWAVVSAIAEGIISSMFTANYEVDMVNFPILLTILVIFALTYIFQYGAMLQQESDETV